MNNIKSEEIIFIINPHSGGQNHTLLTKKIHAIDPYLNVAITQDLEHLATTITSHLATTKVFIIVGGDGSVNAAIQHLYGVPQKIIGVYPVGSGNGFARELGFQHNLEQLIRKAKVGFFKSVNVLSVNNRLGINASGIGFDSLVAHAFQAKQGRGLFNYLKASLQVIRSFNHFSAQITLEKETIKDNFLLISFANTKQYGNNAYISPNSNPSDGKFEVVMVKPMPWFEYPSFIFSLFTKTLSTSKYLEYRTVSNEIHLHSSITKIHIDGEPIETDGNLHIKLMPKFIPVLQSL